MPVFIYLGGSGPDLFFCFVFSDIVQLSYKRFTLRLKRFTLRFNLVGDFLIGKLIEALKNDINHCLSDLSLDLSNLSIVLSAAHPRQVHGS